MDKLAINVFSFVSYAETKTPREFPKNPVENLSKISRGVDIIVTPRSIL